MAGKFLLEERPLIVLPGLAKLIGLNEAIILQQSHWWLETHGHLNDGRRWFKMTYKGWQNQFPFWGLNTIKRAVEALEKDGVLMSTDKLNKTAIDKSKWYSIDYGRFEALTSAGHKKASRKAPETPTTQNGLSTTQNGLSTTQNGSLMATTQNGLSTTQNGSLYSNKKPLTDRTVLNTTEKGGEITPESVCLLFEKILRPGDEPPAKNQIAKAMDTIPGERIALEIERAGWGMQFGQEFQNPVAWVLASAQKEGGYNIRNQNNFVPAAEQEERRAARKEAQAKAREEERRAAQEQKKQDAAAQEAAQRYQERWEALADEERQEMTATALQLMKSNPDGQMAYSWYQKAIQEDRNPFDSPMVLAVFNRIRNQLLDQRQAHLAG